MWPHSELLRFWALFWISQCGRSSHDLPRPHQPGTGHRACITKYYKACSKYYKSCGAVVILTTGIVVLTTDIVILATGLVILTTGFVIHAL